MAVSVLYLYENSITQIIGLHSLRCLTRLYLQSNHISAVENLDTLDRLEVLNLSRNNIAILSNLSLPSLSELLLDYQQLPPGVAFEIDAASINLSRLQTLSLRNVNLQNIKPLATLFSVRKLDVSSNELTSIKDVEFVLRNLCDLHTLNIQDNLITRMLRFREHIVLASSSLECLDERNINAAQRTFLTALSKKKTTSNKQLDSTHMNPTSYSTSHIDNLANHDHQSSTHSHKTSVSNFNNGTSAVRSCTKLMPLSTNNNSLNTRGAIVHKNKISALPSLNRLNRTKENTTQNSNNQGHEVKRQSFYLSDDSSSKVSIPEQYANVFDFESDSVPVKKRLDTLNLTSYNRPNPENFALGVEPNTNRNH